MSKAYQYIRWNDRDPESIRKMQKIVKMVEDRGYKYVGMKINVATGECLVVYKRQIN